MKELSLEEWKKFMEVIIVISSISGIMEEQVTKVTVETFTGHAGPTTVLNEKDYPIF